MINFESMKRRFQAMVSISKLKAYNDKPPDTKAGKPALPHVQFTGMNGELRDKRESYNPYGFTHRPKPGTAEPLMLAINGEKSHSVAVCVADRYHRLELEAEGEVALFDDLEQWVWLKREGIEMKGKKIKIKGDLTITGDVEITGSLEVNGVRLA